MNFDGRFFVACEHRDAGVLGDLIDGLRKHRSINSLACWLLAVVVLSYLAVTIFYAVLARPTGLGFVYAMYLLPAGIVFLFLLRIFRLPDLRSTEVMNCRHGHTVRLVKAKAARLRAILGFTFMVSGAVSAVAGISAQSSDTTLLYVLLGEQVLLTVGGFVAMAWAYRDYIRANGSACEELIAERESLG
jgi:hypothetical protein